METDGVRDAVLREVREALSPRVRANVYADFTLTRLALIPRRCLVFVKELLPI